MKLFTPRESSPANAGADGRRSFLKKLGIGVSTALGSATVLAKPDTDSLAMKVARLEAEQAIRALHQQYEQAMDAANMDAVLALFAVDAAVTFNGGVFNGRDAGLSRLYRQYFANGKTGKRMEPAPGFALSSDQSQATVEIGADMRSARAVLPYSIQVGKPIESTSSLASMARVHGEGVHTWWEGGVYELVYAKDAANAAWKIKRLAYNTLSRADYRAGRSYAKPIMVPGFSARFPADPHGPDHLV